MKIFIEQCMFSMCCDAMCRCKWAGVELSTYLQYLVFPPTEDSQQPASRLPGEEFAIVIWAFRFQQHALIAISRLNLCLILLGTEE